VSTELVNEFSKHDGKPVVDLVVSMHALARRKDDLEESLKAVNKEYDFLRISKIPEKMEDEGIDNISVNGIGRVSLTADMHVSIKAAKKTEFYEWLRDNGRGDLLQENINPSTLKATVKGLVRAGEEVPDDMLNISPFTRASITKT
jgi:hypothetical protein